MGCCCCECLGRATWEHWDLARFGAIYFLGEIATGRLAAGGPRPWAGWQPAVPGLGPAGSRRSWGLFAGGGLFGFWVFCLGNGWRFLGCWGGGDGHFFR